MTRVAVRTLRTAPTAAAGTGATAPLPDQPSVLARVERMYAYTLWMGEAHTPLQCFAKALVSLDGPLDAYLPLLQTPTQLREKYHGSYRDTIMSMLDHPTTESVPDVQGRAMHAAIQHGPFFTAAHSLDHRATAVRVFLSAIQCREYVYDLLTQGGTAADPRRMDANTNAILIFVVGRAIVGRIDRAQLVQTQGQPDAPLARYTHALCLGRHSSSYIAAYQAARTGYCRRLRVSISAV